MEHKENKVRLDQTESEREIMKEKRIRKIKYFDHTRGYNMIMKV